MIVNKYEKENAWEYKIPSSKGVSCWKGIMQLLANYKDIIRVDVGSGREAYFWKDKWCLDRPLMLEMLQIYILACK